MATTDMTVQSARPARRGVRWPRLTPGQMAAFVILVLVSITWIVPFLWMVSTSLKTPQELVSTRFWPENPTIEPYATAFFAFDRFPRWVQWFWNTAIITVLSVIGAVISTTLVAYAFARLRWPGRDLLFGIVLATMMIPAVVTMIPAFIVFSKLPAFGFQGSQNWINTFLPLTVPAFTGNAFFIFLMRQHMRGIPMELSEAARIDGASELQIWWHIIVPLVKPVMGVIAIFTFQGAWEDFMGPLLYLQSENKYTLQLGLRQFEAAAGGLPAWNELMAASLVVMIPVIVVFLAFQRYFIEGIQIQGGVKG
ncbi:MAG TPA: carbohydrate ABC transporter permease [Chloroflexaceae bacterium]|nr:carbohydrate ABC transporter permease [Chloroflexaceae bacterium]